MNKLHQYEAQEGGLWRVQFGKRESKGTPAVEGGGTDYKVTDQRTENGCQPEMDPCILVSFQIWS